MESIGEEMWNSSMYKRANLRNAYVSHDPYMNFGGIKYQSQKQRVMLSRSAAMKKRFGDCLACGLGQEEAAAAAVATEPVVTTGTSSTLKKAGIVLLVGAVAYGGYRMIAKKKRTF